MARWYNASQRYSAAVISTGGLSGLLFDRARCNCEQARAECLRLERLLFEHEQAHGCIRAEMVRRQSA